MSVPTPGDVVTIYRDPLTETDPEGTAELIEPRGALDVLTGLQRWRVVFRDRDDMPCWIRTIRMRPQLVLMAILREAS